MRTFVATCFVLAAGLAAFTWATDGFRVATAEGARRLAVAEHPVTVPDVKLEDMSGRVLQLSQYQGRLLLVDFIYTTCPTVCQDLGQSFAEILKAQREQGRDQDIALLSISFDLENDTQEFMQDFAEHHGADGKVWTIAKPTNAADLQALLATFGVKVLPDPLVGFQHNAAIHLVDRQGRLARIVDPTTEAGLAVLDREVDRL